MQCVVLAAGCSSRFAHHGRPKQLVPVLGLPLLERTIATAVAAGLNDFCVVTGYAAETVEDLLRDVARRRRLRITTVRNDEWQGGNGRSLLAARSYVQGIFVLLVGDHVFDPGIVDRILRERPPDDGVIVAADFQLNGPTMIDPQDATKLAVGDGRVTQIGKHLRRYDAYDTGIFLCSPAVFPALESSVNGGDESLTGGIASLASRGLVRAVEITGRVWVDVDGPASLRIAKRMLQKGLAKPGDGVVARKLNRPASTRVFTPFLLRAFPRITPNQVSILALAVAATAAASFVASAPLAGGLLIALASILDGCDGEVARLKQVQSAFGAYIDATLDRYADATIIAAMGVFAFRAESDSWLASLWGPVVVVVSVLALIGVQMRSYTSVRSIVDVGHRYTGRWIAAGRGRDVRLLTLSLGGIFAALHPLFALTALALVAGVANGVVAARLSISARAARIDGVDGSRPAARGIQRT